MTPPSPEHPSDVWPWPELIGRLFAREGGAAYTDDVHDPGGPTRWGCTIGALSAHRGRKCTAEDVEHLTEAEAREICWKRYVQHPDLRLDLIAEQNPPLLVEVLLDSSYLCGPGRAARWCQEAINARRPGLLVVDGKLGPATRAALLTCDPSAVARRVIAARLRFHARRVQQAPSQVKWLSGWVNRCCEFLEA